MNPAPLKILMVASEAVPFAKTGGLADMVGSLSRELARLGHGIRLVIPRYGNISEVATGLQEWKTLNLPTPDGPIQTVIERGSIVDHTLSADQLVQVLAVRHDPYFARTGLYQEGGVDYPDNLERFAFFSRAVPELIPLLRETSQWVPDVLHAHDWQAALSVVYLKTLYRGRRFVGDLGSLFTVHNMGYQGLFPASAYPKTGLGPEYFTPKTLEFHGALSLLKGGLVFADFLSTTSPTYSRDIQTAEFGFGLEGVLRERKDRLSGVLNGIDIDTWNPADDPHVADGYTASDLKGKRACKASLQRELGLPIEEVPLIAIISRLTEQKGLDLVITIVPELMESNIQMAILGSGAPSLEAEFKSLQGRYPKKIGLRIEYDEGLAHRIMAGSDLFLMPSRYEPCGLTELYAMRYGTVPIVRRTGGLADTVNPYSPRAVHSGQATGFRFGETHSEDLLTTTLFALHIYQRKGEWQSLMRAGMQKEMSWAKPAEAYTELYRRIREG